MALLVDDDPAILDVYEMTLSDLGFTTVLAHDSVSALRVIERQEPSLILLDQRMPGMLGTQLVREVRARGLARVPIVLVTASRQVEREALHAGATVCLEKPFDVSCLIKIILQCTGRQSAA